MFSIEVKDSFNPLYTLPFVLFLEYQLIASFVEGLPAMSGWQIGKLIAAVAILALVVAVLRIGQRRLQLHFAQEGLQLATAKEREDYPIGEITKMYETKQGLVVVTSRKWSANLSVAFRKETMAEDRTAVRNWARKHKIPMETR